MTNEICCDHIFNLISIFRNIFFKGYTRNKLKQQIKRKIYKIEVIDKECFGKITKTTCNMKQTITSVIDM